jgi:hypothetical protein
MVPKQNPQSRLDNDQTCVRVQAIDTSFSILMPAQAIEIQMRGQTGRAKVISSTGPEYFATKSPRPAF